MGVTHIIEIDAFDVETLTSFDPTEVNNATNFIDDIVEDEQFFASDNSTEFLPIDVEQLDKDVSESSGEMELKDFAAKQVLIKDIGIRRSISSEAKSSIWLIVFLLASVI